MIQKCLFQHPGVINFQKRLCKRGLLLQDLKAIEDEILLYFDDLQSFEVASLLEEVERLRFQLLEKRSRNNKILEHKDGKIECLEVWVPVDSKENLSESECLLNASSLVDDLNPRSTASNFYSRMKTIAIQGLQQRSLQPFESNLTSEQKMSVSLFVRGPMDEIKVFFAIDAYIKNLWNQTLSAKQMVAGKVGKSLKLFSHTYGVSDQLISQMRKSLKTGEMTQEEMAHFMMGCIEKQMGLSISA